MHINSREHYCKNAKKLSFMLPIILMQIIGCTKKDGDGGNAGDMPVPQAANLAIYDFQLTGAIARPGEIQAFQFNIKNTGNAPAGEFSITAQYDNAGMEPNDFPSGDRPNFGVIMTGVTHTVAGLGANEAVGKSANVRLALTGVTTITIHVDSNEAIPESDESDNVLVFEILVPTAG